MHKHAKLQSAMEYLMTYGWAILIVAVVLGALFQLGVFSGSSLTPKAQPGACKVFRPNGPGTTMFINLAGVCNGQLPQFVGSFDGQSSYISIPVTPSLNTGQNFAVTFWLQSSQIMAATVAPLQMMDTKGNNCNGWAYFLYYQGQSSINFGQRCISGGSQPPTPILAGKWYFIAGTFSAATNTLTVYINGIQPTTAGTSTSFTYNGPIYIGAGSEGTNLKGMESNVQIYNTSLSQAEIQGLYAEGIGGAPTRLQNLVGWWPLNGNANDYSGNGNNGVPTSVVFTSTWTR
jgi:hypothetical protein